MNIVFKNAVKFWGKWTAPRSPISEERDQEYIVRVVILVTHLLSPLFGLITLLLYLYGIVPYDTPLILFLMAFITGIILKLCDLGYWKIARFVLPLITLSIAIYGNWIGGIDAPVNLIYTLVVILVSILFGGRRWVIVLFFVIIIYFSISYLHYSGIIKQTGTSENFFYNRFIINVATISAIATLIYFIISRLTSALNTAHASTIKLEKLLAENKLLLKEMHHRVKNNLQLMQSLLQLQSDTIDDPHSKEVFREALNRLRSMAITHEQLYRSGELAMIDFGIYIRKLIENIMSSFSISENQIVLECNIESIPLEISKAVPCGLILNELITNAFKHVFTKKNKGKLIVDFFKKENNFYMMVGDDGPGIPSNVQNTQSLGLTLVDLLCKQLKGEIKRKNDNGLKIQITFPC